MFRICSVLCAAFVIMASPVAMAKGASHSPSRAHHHQTHHKKISPLKGSPASLARQNRVADKLGITRIKDDRQLAQFKRVGILKALPTGRNVRADRRLARKFRYCRPAACRQIAELGRGYRKHFGAPVVVTSAVRTKAYQRQLTRRNANAAKAKSGLRQSSHPTGLTYDITKKGMSTAGKRWMRRTLTQKERAGQLEATEEFRQPVFHIMATPAKPKRQHTHHR